jgi:hypothetical protein
MARVLCRNMLQNWQSIKNIRVMKTNLIHCLSSVYFLNQPLHVSNIFVAHHQEIYCVYLANCLLAGRPTDSQLTLILLTWRIWWARNNASKWQMGYNSALKGLNIYSIPPDDGLQICPKHVEVDWRNIRKLNSASSWFSLHGYIEMHGQQNMKKKYIYI